MKTSLVMACALFSGSIFFGSLSGAEENNPWKNAKLNVGMMFSKLSKEGIGSDLNTSDVFDRDANGFDINGEFKLDDQFSYLIGYNSIEFKGTTESALGLTIRVEDVDASAVYGGLKYSFLKFSQGSAFVVGQLGFGMLSDVSYTLESSSVSLLREKSFKGSTNLYRAIGLGIDHQFGDSGFGISSGYYLRQYGSLEGKASAVIPTKDFDVDTQGFDVSLNYRF